MTESNLPQSAAVVYPQTHQSDSGQIGVSLMTKDGVLDWSWLALTSRSGLVNDGTGQSKAGALSKWSFHVRNHGEMAQLYP